MTPCPRCSVAGSHAPGCVLEPVIIPDAPCDPAACGCREEIERLREALAAAERCVSDLAAQVTEARGDADRLADALAGWDCCDAVTQGRGRVHNEECRAGQALSAHRASRPA